MLNQRNGVVDTSLKVLRLLWKGILSLIYFLESKIDVFEPDSNLIFFEKVLVILFTVCNLFFIPLCITFGIERDNTDFWINFMFVDIPFIILLLNSLITMNTAFYSRGVFIKDRKQILFNYCKNYLLLDILIANAMLMKLLLLL